MGNRHGSPENVTPLSLRSPEESTSTGTDHTILGAFQWGYSGSRQHILNFLGGKIQNIATTADFIDAFPRSLKTDDIDNIRDLFDAVEFTLPQTVAALHFFTVINCRFLDVFANERQRCKCLFGGTSEISLGTFIERHCRGALVTHCYIIRNLDDLLVVDKTLNAIAASHVFLSKLSLSIKKHDDILFKFLKNEFKDYKPKATFASLEKYFKIISTRTQLLIEQKVLRKSMSEMLEALEFMKNIRELYELSKEDSFREIFHCDSANRYSQSAIFPLKSSTSIKSYVAGDSFSSMSTT